MRNSVKFSPKGAFERRRLCRVNFMKIRLFSSLYELVSQGEFRKTPNYQSVLGLNLSPPKKRQKWPQMSVIPAKPRTSLETQISGFQPVRKTPRSIEYEIQEAHPCFTAATLVNEMLIQGKRYFI